MRSGDECRLVTARLQADRDNNYTTTMNKFLIAAMTGLLATSLFTGCIGLQLGGGDKRAVQNATVGQQLMDLKAARDTGAISEVEYQSQKSKVLGNR